MTETAYRDAARDRVQRIRLAVQDWVRDLTEAYLNRDWQTLDYPDWQSYLRDEFGDLTLSADQRSLMEQMLATTGMSQRAIAQATGQSQATVGRHLATGSSEVIHNESPHLQAATEGYSQLPPDNNVWLEPAPSPPPVSLPEPPPEPRPTVGLDGKVYPPRPQPAPQPVAPTVPQPYFQPPQPPAHVRRNTGENEWYTPPEYTKAAREVMGGIDLDPASTAEANDRVGAARFWTAEDDGLAQEWAGRIWLNPPYERGLVDKFCMKLAEEFEAGRVTEAIVLVNNSTDSAWFQGLLGLASAVCYPLYRIRFWHPTGRESNPLQGQAVLYLGTPAGAACFAGEFATFGQASVWESSART